MIKRFFDFHLALIALLLTTPFMFVVSLLVRYNLGSPVFFKQQRPGLYGKPYINYKFRTMTILKIVDTPNSQVV